MSGRTLNRPTDVLLSCTWRGSLLWLTVPGCGRPLLCATAVPKAVLTCSIVPALIYVFIRDSAYSRCGSMKSLPSPIRTPGWPILSIKCLKKIRPLWLNDAIVRVHLSYPMGTLHRRPAISITMIVWQSYPNTITMSCQLDTFNRSVAHQISLIRVLEDFAWWHFFKKIFKWLANYYKL